MAAPQTTADFLDLASRSGLVAADRIRDFMQSLAVSTPALTSARRIATRMIENGLLTKLQAQLLLKGKWKNYIIFGKYKLLEHIGAGGMGKVFLCEHVLLNRRVAIKVLPADRAEDAVSIQRFYREARAAAALDHPNIVRAHDIDTDGSLHFLVMEYVDGSNLSVIVDRRGQLALPRAVDYVLQAAAGLQHAHEAGLVHRDVKPSNLLVDRHGTLKVLDLGLARFQRESGEPLTKHLHGKNILGTADFLAPEQARDSHAADARSDLYGLGATLYFMLTGRAPFAGDTIAKKLLAHQRENPTPVDSIRADVSVELAAIVGRMMAKDPDQRFQSCAELIGILQPLAPTALPLPEPDEMPKLCPASRLGEASAGRKSFAERSSARSRPNTGSFLKAKSRSDEHPVTRFRLPGRLILAIVFSVVGLLIGVAAGKYLLPPLTTSP